MTEELKIIRDERGRIVTRTGAVPNAGRPRADDAERIRDIMRAVLDEETVAKWQAAMRKKLAKGNGFAAEYIRDTLGGKPAVNANVQVSSDLAAFMDAWNRASGKQAGETPDDAESQDGVMAK